MLNLNLPQANFKIRLINDKKYIFDFLRKKYVRLTPEEYVRQCFVNYLAYYRKYPVGLMANEISLGYNNLKFRCDTVVYSQYMKPLVIVEYKAPNVEINMEVLKQIYRYNLILKVKYLIVSNGMTHYCLLIDYDNNEIKPLNGIPDYQDLL